MEAAAQAKRAAALAAVFSYLARGAGLERGAPQQQAAVQSPGASLWALYGRQALMSQAIRLQARRRG